MAKKKRKDRPGIEASGGVGLELHINVPLQTRKPVVLFGGEWTTKDVKLILRAIPRAYRLWQVERRKQGIGLF